MKYAFSILIIVVFVSIVFGVQIKLNKAMEEEAALYHQMKNNR